MEEEGSCFADENIHVDILWFHNVFKVKSLLLLQDGGHVMGVNQGERDVC